MKKLYLLIITLWCATGFLFAQKDKGTVTSEYKKGEFISSASITINAPEKAVHQVLTDFVNQYNHDFERLFEWALPGLKLRGEQDDFIMFNIKSHKHNKTQNYVDGLMDINVLLLKKNIENIAYKTRTKQTRNSANERILEYEMFECQEVMEYVNTTIRIVPIADNKTKCTFDVRVRLGFPYRLMTMSQFRSSMEWRFTRFLSNLRDEAEKNSL